MALKEFYMASDGGFFAVSDRGNWSYAYPTSPRAHDAKRFPEHNAKMMATNADIDAAMCPRHIVDRHNEYLRGACENAKRAAA